MNKKETKVKCSSEDATISLKFLFGYLCAKLIPLRTRLERLSCTSLPSVDIITS